MQACVVRQPAPSCPRTGAAMAAVLRQRGVLHVSDELAAAIDEGSDLQVSSETDEPSAWAPRRCIPKTTGVRQWQQQQQPD